jgi:serine/threonine-protein kinase
MAYEMLSGKLPWEANTAWEWASKHMTEAPTPLERQPLGPHIPQRMRDAVAKALAKDKNQRFSSVREFFDAFSGGAAPVPVLGGPQAGVAITPQHGGTSMINSTPQSGPNERMKTEMGAPAMNPMSMGPGVGAQPGGYGPPPAIAQPNMVTAGSAQEKKSPVLIIVLGGLAALLLIGAGIAAVAGGHKTPTTTGGLDLGSAATTPAPVPAPATTDTVATAVTSAAPLAAPEPAPVPHPNAAPAPKPAPGPAPAKPSPKPDPKSCVDARNAKAAHAPAAVLSSLEKKCRDEGGSL